MNNNFQNTIKSKQDYYNKIQNELINKFNFNNSKLSPPKLKRQKNIKQNIDTQPKNTDF